MILVVTEKNDAATQIARLLSESGKPKADRVYSTPIYRFKHDGEDWVTIGLRGHIMAPGFPHELKYSKKEGWYGLTDGGEKLPAHLPDTLAKPPYPKAKNGRIRKPFEADGVDIKGWKIPALPYLVWSPIEKVPAEKEIIRSLKNLAKKADSIIIATDFDREGELIGSDALRQVRQVAPNTPVSRARYSAFTKQEITHAFTHLVPLDQDLADAGESRQCIDLIWGAALTRYLTTARFAGLGNTRSAGRVQTPTLALVVQREKEREAFVPKPYWVISGELSHADDTFKVRHTTARFWDKDKADVAYSAVKDAKKAKVVDVTKKSRTVRPPAPFNTTSLQAAAAAEGLAPGRTMRIAESLYMRGLISYPRVDNTVYPHSLDLKETVFALSGVPQYSKVCRELMAQPRLTATRGRQETTDHPPIYPTAAADPTTLTGADWKLYNLIARRFLATLMGPATIESTKLTFDIAKEPFQATGDVLAKAGFRAIYPYGLKKDEQLPPLKVGDVCTVEHLNMDAKATEPPARYSQGKLIQEMEKHNLGTKSTRASIIDRLYEVKYLRNNPIEPSQLGMAVIEVLHTYAPHITTPDMTSELEQDMNQVAEGKETQAEVVDHSRALLAGMLDALIVHEEDLSDAIADALTADARIGVCPKCGHDLVVKSSAKTHSSFVGCTNWPDCDVTYPLPRGRIEALEGDAAVCPECGAPRIKVHPFRSRAYEMCVNPKCPTNYEPDVVVGECPACAKEGKKAKLIAHKSEKTGKRFIRCENYEECGTSYPLPARGKLEATGETCPACGAPSVIVHTARGPWKLCPNPKCPDNQKRVAARGSRRRGGTRTRRSARTSRKTTKA
ncbi:MAG: DNA topoisomerase I [Coriobacteriaceae bacterium]